MTDSGVVSRFKSWNSNLPPEKKIKYVASTGMFSWAWLWASDLIELYSLFVENAGQISSEQIQSLTVANTGTTILFMIYIVVFLGIPGLADIIEGLEKIVFSKLNEKEN